MLELFAEFLNFTSTQISFSDSVWFCSNDLLIMKSCVQDLVKTLYFQRPVIQITRVVIIG